MTNLVHITDDMRREAENAPVRSALRLRGVSGDDADWWINTARVRLADKEENFDRFGFKCKSIILPYFDLDAAPILDAGRPFERARLLPLQGYGAGPAGTGKFRYRQEDGTELHAYLPRLPGGRLWRDVFKNTDTPIIITEGEFKAGKSTISPRGLPTVGIGGIDCLSGRSGDIVPELAGCRWTDRLVYFAFDAPVTVNITAAIVRGANYLLARGARVKVCYIENTTTYKALENPDALPDAPKPKMGLDDYLYAGGTWDELEKTSKEEIDSIGGNHLFSSIAIIQGPATPCYVQITGNLIGTIRNNTSMGEILSDHFVARTDEKGNTKWVSAYKDWKSNPRRVKLNNVVVRPDLPALAITPNNDWNRWPGMVTVPKRNRKWARYFRRYLVDFFRHNVEDRATIRLHRKKFLQGMAFHFQKPGVLQSTSWTFKSVDEGIGKSTLLELPAHIIGEHDGGGAYIATADDLESPWTDYLAGPSYILYNEPSNNNDKMRGKVKNLRTQSHLLCNTKYGAKFRVPNIIWFGFTTNEEYAFGMSEVARRDWFWEPQWKDTDKKWIAIARRFGELACSESDEAHEFRAAVLWELLYNTDISDYDPRAPAGNSKAKMWAAKQGKAKTVLHKEGMLERILKTLETEDAIAWMTEDWAVWVGEGYNPSNASTDKQWLSKELIKKGFHCGSVDVKYQKRCHTAWMVGKGYWSALQADQKKRAFDLGRREAHTESDNNNSMFEVGVSGATGGPVI